MSEQQRVTRLVVAAVIEQEGKYLLAQRQQGDSFGGLWEFPGGKIKPGESPEEALRRECLEEMNIEVKALGVCDVLFQRNKHSDILLLFYHCQIVGGELKAIECEATVWVAPDEMDHYPLLPGDKPMAEKLKQGINHR